MALQGDAKRRHLPGLPSIDRIPNCTRHILVINDDHHIPLISKFVLVGTMMHLAPRAPRIRRDVHVRVFVILEVFTDAADAHYISWSSTGEDTAEVVWRGDGVEVE